MNTKFYNARILTLSESGKSGDLFDIIEGELWVEENRITYVGTPKESDHLHFDEEIDVNGNLLMPGFKNAHTHSAMTFLRSYADDLPLHDWLNNQVFPMEAKLTGEDMYHLSKLAILEYLTSGITANLDMYFCPKDVAQASIDMGFRTVLNAGVNNFTGSISENIDFLEKNHKKFNSYHELIQYKIGLHAEYTASSELLSEIANLANHLQAPIYTHCSETKYEVEECIKRYKMTPTTYLNSLGMFNYGGGCFHCVHMTQEDLEIIKDKNVSVVTNPASNLKLASGIAPVKKMMDMGINLAIGTDGPASNNALDMFREMYLTTGLQKVQEMDASAVDANKVLYMATIGGSKAMGLTKADTLEVGKLADLIMIDLHQPNMQPINNITKNIVYSGSKQNIKLTMVNGKILYRDNRFFVNEDPEDIYEKANKIIQMKKD